jgi:hypothetical protein
VDNIGVVRECCQASAAPMKSVSNRQIPVFGFGWFQAHFMRRISNWLTLSPSPSLGCAEKLVDLVGQRSFTPTPTSSHHLRDLLSTLSRRAIRLDPCCRLICRSVSHRREKEADISTLVDATTLPSLDYNHAHKKASCLHLPFKASSHSSYSISSAEVP